MKFNVIPLTPTEGKAELDLFERGLLHDALLSFLMHAAVQYLPKDDDHNDKIKLGADLLRNETARSDFHSIDLKAREARLLAEVIDVYAVPKLPEHEERIVKLATGFRAAAERLALNLAPGQIRPMSAEEIDLELSYVVIPEDLATMPKQ